MRFLVFVFTFSTFISSHGQNVFNEFKDTLCYEDFHNNSTNKFPQKFNSLELSVVEDGGYRINRIKSSGQSIAYFKENESIENFELITTLKFPKSKSISSGGIIFHSQSSTMGAILFELNSENKYRITKLINHQSKILSGEPKFDGWVKNSLQEKSGNNVITIRTNDGFTDFYINGSFVNTFFDLQLKKGKVGLFAGAESQIIFDDFLLKTKQKENALIEFLSDKQETTNEPNVEFQEVILIFKTKIDNQQAIIKKLKKQVDKYRSMLNYDTTIIARVSLLEVENKILSYKLDSTTRVLNQNQKRLVYLESIKDDVENGSNGDLVLNLTSILADLKRENKFLKKNQVDYSNTKKQLKEDNKILLREIDRLKSLVKSQN